MPLQNRVTPEGEIVAATERGTMLGNRGGCFHRPDKTLLKRRFASRQWICCVLDFKGRRRALMQPGLYTELFFLDEATAFAAGHRPCFECRRADAVRYAELWNAIDGVVGRAAVPAMDARLHAERIDRAGRKVVYEERLSRLPDGVIVRHRGAIKLLSGGRLLPWSLAGYGAAPGAAADEPVAVLTPRSTVAVLARGYTAAPHPSAVGIAS